MSEGFREFVMGILVGIICCLVVLILVGVDTSDHYCPAILENAPDTLAVAQEFPKCLKYTERGEG